MAKTASRPNRTSPPLRLSYTQQLFKASSMSADAKPKFGVTVMLDKKDKEHQAYLKQLHADLQACLAEEWPDEKTRPRPKLVGDAKSPIKDGDTTCDTNGIPWVEKNPEYAGHWFIRVYSGNRPVLVDRNLGEIIDSNELYGGCFAKVGINAYAFRAKNAQGIEVNKGVTLGLNGVQKWADGESFGGGRPSADSMFEASGADDPTNYSASDDPFASGGGAADDDDIPF